MSIPEPVLKLPFRRSFARNLRLATGLKNFKSGSI
jgi:hypothetical protein